MTFEYSEVSIIGAGPAGLMAAEVLSQAGVKVDVFDAMPSVGRKFLMAGKGGMNITHAEPLEQFLSRYGPQQEHLTPMILAFSPDALRAWVKDLGIETFVGSSGRVFPTEMKAAPLLRAWLHRLRVNGVRFHMRQRWQGWSADGKLVFDTQHGEQRMIQPKTLILALGGASWPQLGSTGFWAPWLAARGICVMPLQATNCGFETLWSAYFRSQFAGQPIKTVRINFENTQGQRFSQQGELMVSDYGLEGGLIYALSAPLREQINLTGSALITLDLLPDRDLASIITKLSGSRGKNSLSNFLRKQLSLDSVKIALLREVLSTEEMNHPHVLAQTLKAIPIKLIHTRPIAEAISSAGGVSFTELNQQLMLNKLPGVFCCGEMLDWEAPTGGYLLTACLASGRAAGFGALAWLNR